MSSSKFFPPLVVGALKPSITFISLASPPLTPSCSPYSLSLPSCSPCSLSLPSCSPCSLSPLAPTEVVGTPKHSVTYPYPTLAIGSERGVRGGEGARGVRRSKRSNREREGASHLVKLSLPDIGFQGDCLSFTPLFWVSHCKVPINVNCYVFGSSRIYYKQNGSGAYEG